MPISGQEAGPAGTARMGAQFTGSFSTAAGRRLRSLGIYLLVVGVSCVLCAATVIGLVNNSCTEFYGPCGQRVYCGYSARKASDESVACTVTSVLFVVAGSLTVATSRRRNRCRLLTSVVFSSLAAMGAVVVIAVGGAAILPHITLTLSRGMSNKPHEPVYNDMPAKTTVPVYRHYVDNNGPLCNSSMAWAEHSHAMAIWEKNILITKLSLAFTVVMMTLALACLTLSLWSSVHVCRSVCSTAVCKTQCPGCWTWCFDQLEDGASAEPLTAPTTPHTECDKHPLVVAIVTQEYVAT